jgi:hypothetical protein
MLTENPQQIPTPTYLVPSPFTPIFRSIVDKIKKIFSPNIEIIKSQLTPLSIKEKAQISRFSTNSGISLQKLLKTLVFEKQTYKKEHLTEINPISGTTEFKTKTTEIPGAALFLIDQPNLENLPNLHELPKCLKIYKKLRVENCPQLKQINSCLKEVQELEIIDCPQLQTLPPLPNVKKIIIKNCPNLEKLPQCPNLQIIKIENSLKPANSLEIASENLQIFIIRNSDLETIELKSKLISQLKVENCKKLTKLERPPEQSPTKLIIYKNCPKLIKTIIQRDESQTIQVDNKCPQIKIWRIIKNQKPHSSNYDY